MTSLTFKKTPLQKIAQMCRPLALALALSLASAYPAVSMPQAQASVMMDFSDLVEQVSPAVVKVSITKKLSDEALAQAQTLEILRQYFGGRVNLPEVPAVEHGYGSGFFISRDGYILTNHHVVEGADQITVTLNDRTELDAVLVGSDESSDVAVLKVAGNHFMALPIAKQELRVGEPVLAIGSPFGFDYSASAGIVSAKSRNLGREATVPFIQSDVALNQGNSGGPLFNKNGEVVGVNSRIFSGTGGHMGLSFSIPIDAAMDIYEQIKTHGKVTRVYLGIVAQDIDRNLAQVYGFERPQGALLTHVLPNSPAKRAGLGRGDVVLSFNDIAITHAADLFNLINRAKPQDNFTIKYRKAGQNKDTIATGRFDEIAKDIAGEKHQQDKAKLGVRLRALDVLEAKNMGLRSGVMVTLVEPMGAFAKAGIQSGDVILDLNRHPIRTVQDFSIAATKLPSTGVIAVSIIRHGIPFVVGVRLDDN